MRLKSFTLSIFLFLSFYLQAAEVDSVTVYSNSMRKNIKCVVIKPDSYKTGKSQFPTVYLLHGFSGNFTNWIIKVPQLKTYADDYQLLVVCPDGAYSSWYFNSPVDSNMRYETFITSEVPFFIDKNYRTIADRKARAITGLSMGGHGGLFLGFRHADFFSACGSMSGALLIERITARYDVEKRLGDTSNKQLYRDYSIMNVMEKYPKDSVAIIIDCGVDDFIIDMSRQAHQKMLSLKIPHDYTERPGRHDWNYWATAVQYQLLFFRNHFNRLLLSTQNKMPL